MIRKWVFVAVTSVAAGLLSGCAGAGRIDTARAYLDAGDRGDHEAVRALLADDARFWFETREGDGVPLNPGGGRWATWDRVFNSRSEPISPLTEDKLSVQVVMRETNDYYQLLGRKWSRFTLTWFFDDDGRIEGLLLSPPPPAPPGQEQAESYLHREAFEAWAKANEPEEWAYLRPDEEIDPTGDRAERTKSLLLRWREAAMPDP